MFETESDDGQSSEKYETDEEDHADGNSKGGSMSEESDEDEETKTHLMRRRLDRTGTLIRGSCGGLRLCGVKYGADCSFSG